MVMTCVCSAWNPQHKAPRSLSRQAAEVNPAVFLLNWCRSPQARLLLPAALSLFMLCVSSISAASTEQEHSSDLFRSEEGAVASELFSHVQLPSPRPARAIGYYSQGCLAGAIELPQKGPNWQVMRPSRNRNWGHPELVSFIARLATSVTVHTGWPGILVGDMAQPRGGPLPFGHASHQIGLDVDIWFQPMPKGSMSTAQADTIPTISVVAPNGDQLDPNTWQPADRTLIRLAAEQPEVERVFVNPAIKKALCETRAFEGEGWIRKVRPWYGHRSHMHVRLKCPSGSADCKEQTPVPEGDGCSKTLDEWFSPPDVLSTLQRLITPRQEKPPMLIRDLPSGCASVLRAANENPSALSRTRARWRQ
jgi:penicillin-insensitive murein DD-endopeptidase